MLDPWERRSFPLQVLSLYLILLYRLRPTSIAWSILPWPWTETYYSSSGKDAHTRNKREGAQLSNNTIKGNASQQTCQGAGLGKKEKAELKRDRPLWRYLLWRIHRWSRTTKVGDQFSLYLKVNSPFLHQTLLAISLGLVTFFSDQNSFFRDTHDSEFRVVTLYIYIYIYIIMILFSVLGTYAYVHTHIHRAL